MIAFLLTGSLAYWLSDHHADLIYNRVILEEKHINSSFVKKEENETGAFLSLKCLIGTTKL